ncbi:MAG: hypothetical protein ACK4N5_01955 [Myxococcales bacterium]
MTEAQALRVARTRWGGDGHVETETDRRTGEIWYRVGVRQRSQFEVHGDSRDSWEDAFRDADRRSRS